jgi:hypothetical protein
MNQVRETQRESERDRQTEKEKGNENEKSYTIHSFPIEKMTNGNAQ